MVIAHLFWVECAFYRLTIKGSLWTFFSSKEKVKINNNISIKSMRFKIQRVCLHLIQYSQIGSLSSAEDETKNQTNNRIYV